MHKIITVSFLLLVSAVAASMSGAPDQNIYARFTELEKRIFNLSKTTNVIENKLDILLQRTK